MKGRRSSRQRAFSFGRAACSLAFVLVPPTLALGALGTWMEYAQIEQKMLAKFEGERWDVAARIYSDSYTVYPGLRVDTESFRRRIERLGYDNAGGTASRRGTYSFSRSERSFAIYLNQFDYGTRQENGRLIRMTLDESGRIVSMRSGEGNTEISEFELEPALLSGDGYQAEQRQVLRLDQFPPMLVRAVLAVEDRRFFEHAGVDVWGLSRALASKAPATETLHDASTLTQQLMDSFFVGTQRTPARQVREAALALVAERRLGKEEILEHYLNEIAMGRSGSSAVRGMADAARFYFGRPVGDLTLAEVATLAGVVRDPDLYSPHRDPERARSRRDEVLSALYDTGEIDQAAYELALNEPMQAAMASGSRSPHFVDYVTRELTRRYPERVLQSGGYRIFTTLDAEMQAIAEHVVADNITEMENDIGEARAKAGEPLQCAMVVLEPRTGAVRAMVGGRDYASSGYNRALDMRRIPGSTVKPIVALAALGSEQVGARHYRPTSLVMDERMSWEWQGQVWSPRNYEGEFYGYVTIREAVEHSLNSAIARISKDVGVKPIRDLAVRMGIGPDLGVYPSIVLGGFTVPLMDMAKVFNVFATGGMRVTPRSVNLVMDGDGREQDGSPVEVRRIVPATDAYLVTHILEGVMERGTGQTARRKGFKHPAAGKTGTSNDYKDAWFVGFTPNLLAAVWVGFDNNSSMEKAGSEAALPVWTDFMRRALADTPHDSFEIPDGVVIADVDKKNGKLAKPECPKQVREAFIAGEEPREVCGDHGGTWR